MIVEGQQVLRHKRQRLESIHEWEGMTSKTVLNRLHKLRFLPASQAQNDGSIAWRFIPHQPLDRAPSKRGRRRRQVWRPSSKVFRNATPQLEVDFSIGHGLRGDENRRLHNALFRVKSKRPEAHVTD
jgi:hypothetical protein